MNTRLALIGAGVIGKRHMEAVAATGNAELVAIADPAATVDAGRVPVYAEFAEMLAEVRPDGVIVATPTEHHLLPALAALDANAHVLVEKPITATLAEANALVEMSAESGLHVLVGHHRRYYPAVHKAREILRSGALGDLLGVSGQWTVRKADAYYNPDWRKKREAGPILTNLIHEIDSLRFICGEIASISAEVASVRGFEKEDTAALTIRFANGALGSFLLSDAAPSPWAWEFATGENPAFPHSGQNPCRFMGSRAALDFPNLVLWQHPEGEPDWNQPIEPTPIRTTLGDAYAAQCAHFCAVIRGSEPPRITAADAAETLRATLAVFDAAASGARVDLSRQSRGR
jgi:predicted dehydrogenase